jgi:hypothetical protein
VPGSSLHFSHPHFQVPSLSTGRERNRVLQRSSKISFQLNFSASRTANPEVHFLYALSSPAFQKRKSVLVIEALGTLRNIDSRDQEHAREVNGEVRP